MDEDRARAWIGKVKSAFQRDQTTEEEKCLTFGDLMVQELAPATESDYQDQMGGSTRELPNTILQSGSEETPLDYLYRLNVAALRAKLKIKGGNPKARREHVDHYIETLGDPELAYRLTLLRLADVDDLEEVLRARERAKTEEKLISAGGASRAQIQHDPERKRRRKPGSRIDATPEAEITKIETVVLTVGRGNIPI
ncbi:LOW QUALITY PROTEIN: hypothetical protein PHMEG_00039755 [Phytophthora megakarya]|uniref:Eukaryotic/viral aspartic protease n=1 Tax=Phytophthora megakarya TaxID=4795 RepID=A0A225UES9_9STRA|nr:LOW QUALITY PROTEIN: hypothetical protein PHMEG_00039755 [Phytophthora megakarya]